MNFLVLTLLISINLYSSCVPDCCSNFLESKEWFVDVGENITLPCNENLHDTHLAVAEPVMWIKTGREEEQISRLKILPDGSLSLEKVIKSDTGEYMCRLEKVKSETDEIIGKELMESNEIQIKYKLVVRSKWL